MVIFGERSILEKRKNFEQKYIHFFKKSTRKKIAVFFNIVQKAFDPPPPLLFEHHVVNFLSENFK